MRQVTVAGLFALLLICAGCAERERSVTQTDANARDEAPGAAQVDNADRDAGQASVDPSVDLHFLLIAALLETERTLTARCPCLTASGEYKSMSECVSAVSLGRSWIDCTNRVDLSAYDSAAARENLRCNIAELMQRTECLMGSSCTEHAIAACMSQSMDCSVLPWEILSHVASECRVAFSR